MENRESFGEYFAQKRKEAGLTQKQVADKLFVTDSAVSKWERGKSYPDITLVHDICSVLQVSEHELLTASEDVKSRADERLAQQYKKMKNKYKIGIYALLGAIAVIGFISNIATEHTLSWFFVLLGAEAVVASLLLVPVFAEKNKWLVTLAAFTISVVGLMAITWGYAGGSWLATTIVGFLLGISVVFLPCVLQNIVLPAPLSNHKLILYLTINSLIVFLLVLVANWPQIHWFFTKGVPVTAVCLTLPWVFAVIIKYVKTNKYFKAAACLGFAAIFTFYINGLIEWMLGTVPYFAGRYFHFSGWASLLQSENINATVCLAIFGLGLLFAVAGTICEVGKSGSET